MTHLVVGGGGFIGREVVSRLVEDGRTVVCADVDWHDSLPEAATRVDCDVTDSERVAEVVATHGPDRVVHLSSLLTSQTADSPRYGIEVNSQGTANVMHAAATNGVDRLVYASSIAAYGDPADYAESVLEDAEVPAVFSRYPVTLYAATKQFNEYQGRFYDDNYDTRVVGVRPGVVFGPGRSSGLAGWASSFVSAPAHGETGHIPIPPDEEMSMVFRDDVAEIFVTLCGASSVTDDAYNTGGHRVTARRLADIVESELGEPVTCDESGDPIGLIPGPSHERAREEFGYDLTPLPKSIRDHAAAARGE